MPNFFSVYLILSIDFKFFCIIISCLQTFIPADAVASDSAPPSSGSGRFYIPEHICIKVEKIDSL